MKWRVILEQDENSGEWAAWCPELLGCTSAGETEEAALRNIREAIELYLQPDPFRLPRVQFRERSLSSGREDSMFTDS